ncbi:MAG: transcriptional regulator [Actinomycetia bacterium]|nr:transcriptional regulator [Actinomycetes bacterium]MCP4223412.1 transcriptional regulator [Actinomycetes bacterium]MCP5032790.1 transcriptional regulator [Actinomycetes bacterium]
MTRSEYELLAMHGLRLRGLAEAVVVADLIDEPSLLIHVALRSLAERGLVVYRVGHRSGWTLTPAGMEEHKRLLAAELDRTGKREPFTHCYQVFVPLNVRFLQLCTRWQVRSLDGAKVLNDHGDQVYDQVVIDDLAAIDSEIQPLVSKLADLLDRYVIHGDRLANALARVLADDYDWLASPLIDSYHTVWFELHQDLLVTLGIDRASEPSPSGALG